jgi:hypothetical protein
MRGRQAERFLRGLLLGIEERVEVSGHVGAGPILWADDFAVDAAFPIDDVGVGIHRGSVLGRDFLRSVAVIGIKETVGGEELAIGIVVIVHADAENGAATRRNPLLQKIQGGRFVNAGRAPGGPEIQKYNFAAQIG